MQEGQIVRNKRTGEMGRVVNGQVVPINGPAPMTIGQPSPYKGRQAEADVQKTQTDVEVTRATAPATIRKAEADAIKAEVEASEARQEARLWDNAQERKAIRETFQTDSILRALRNARKIVQEEGGVGVESLFSGLPTTTARKLETELAPVKGNLAFGNLQKMREESKTGAAVGSVTERELDLLASTVASLDQGVDAKTFLQRLDAIERHFIGMQLNALGIDPSSDEGRAAFKNEYNYSGVFDGETPQGDFALANRNAQQSARELPDEYQKLHLQYLRENWGRMDPEAYVRFRSGLDDAFGQRPDLGAYENAARQWNDYAAQGGNPESLGAVPAPTGGMSTVEQGINYAAQSAPGAFFASVGNATGAGLPAYLSGDQRKLELLREARPYSSFAGEMAGGALGTAALAGAGGLVGSGRAAMMLGNPFASEVAHSSVYGATQDDNALRGAGFGALGAIGGSYLGQKIGRAFPETFAGKAIQKADESAPTGRELKDRASDLYSDLTTQGIEASADDTTDLAERARMVLAGNGRIGPQGQNLIQDGSTKQAYDLLQSYAGNTMTPNQALVVRETLGEGLTSNVPKERRIASMLLNDFDDWSKPVMPGAEKAREVSSRYIRGQQLQDLAGLGQRRGARMKGNDVADSTRTLFGQLDEKVAKGQAYFDEPTQEAISRVAQGDKFTNALRQLGKFGWSNPLTAGGIGVGSGGAVLGLADPLYAGAAAAAATGGTLARRLANARTNRAAIEAELLALGGDDYARILDEAKNTAQIRGGRFGGGIFGSGTTAYRSRQ